MIKCPHCHKPITEVYVMENLPKGMIASEGARAMSLRNTRRNKFDEESGRKAALARWGKKK